MKLQHAMKAIDKAKNNESMSSQSEEETKADGKNTQGSKELARRRLENMAQSEYQEIMEADRQVVEIKQQFIEQQTKTDEVFEETYEGPQTLAGRKGICCCCFSNDTGYKLVAMFDIITIVRSIFAILALCKPTKSVLYAKVRFITFILISLGLVCLYLYDLFNKALDDVHINFIMVIGFAAAGVFGIILDFHYTRVVDFYAKSNFVLPAATDNSKEILSKPGDKNEGQKKSKRIIDDEEDPGFGDASETGRKLKQIRKNNKRKTLKTSKMPEAELKKDDNMTFTSQEPDPQNTVAVAPKKGKKKKKKKKKKSAQKSDFVDEI